MSAPPFTEQQQLDVLTWCMRARAQGTVSPSDREIAKRLKLRNTDEALALLQELVRAGRIEIRRVGLAREIDVIVPPEDAAPAAAPAATPALADTSASQASPSQAAPRIVPETDRLTVQLILPAERIRQLRREASEAKLPLGRHLGDRLLEASCPPGKPFLRATVIRAASSSPIGFWPFISQLIEAGLDGLDRA